MQEERKKQMTQIMDNLKNFLGQEVIVIYWQKGKLNGVKGKFLKVNTFDSLTLDDGVEISFAGVDTAIEAIFLGEERLIYYNSEVENYQGFSLMNIMGLILAQEELLGYSVKREEVENGVQR